MMIVISAHEEAKDSDYAPDALFGALPVQRIRFEVEFEPGNHLPSYLGSAWRGLLGWQIKRLVCPFQRRNECGNCSIASHCPYWKLFEKQSNMPREMDTPRGYILYGPGPGTNGLTSLDITLIGNCSNMLPVVVKAMVDGQEKGLGARRQGFRIYKIIEIQPGGDTKTLTLYENGTTDAGAPPELSSWLCASRSKLRLLKASFTTPVRLRKSGRYLGTMDWPFFLMSVARRLEALCCLYNDATPLGRERWLELSRSLEKTGVIKDEMEWHEYSRYSARQRRKVPLGGLVGQATVRPASKAMAKWWQAVELVHVGKGSAMGLGKVVIEEGNSAKEM